MDYSLPEERKYYRVAISTRILLGGGGVMFLALAGLSLPSIGMLFSGFFLLFGLFSLYCFIDVSRTVFITRTGIGTRRFGMEQFIRWENIAEAQPKGDDSLSLMSTDQMTTLKISTALANYAELVERVRQVRPYLWKAENLKVFHVKKGMLVGWLVICLLPAALTIFSLLNRQNGFELASAFFLFITLGMLWVMVRLPVSIHLNEKELVIKRLIGAVRIPRSDLQMVALGEIGRVNTVAMQGVTICVHDSRRQKPRIIQFVDIKEGSAALYASLLEWGGFEQHGEKPGGGPF